ncbi:MAG TPA: TIGR00303 family protein [Candidatus Nitrosocosmicus sp.]|nr:TIGR00303 family protein [Candidatus Nitrosocosmicus sp.]
MNGNFIRGINSRNAIHDLQAFKSDKSAFIFLISYTATSTIPGLTVAGANPQLIKFTPPADAEYIHYGKCKSVGVIPATPDGKPTPAIITKTALDISNIPIYVVDSGSEIKPILPYVTVDSPSGKNILNEPGLEYQKTLENYEMGKILGRQMSKVNDTIILGESVPGGTTTALGVMQAMGINAFNKVSSSMPDNPHTLKNKIIELALLRSNLKTGDCSNDPFKAISNLGDPMMPTAAGIAEGVISSGKRIILGGGTQMCCIMTILKSLDIHLKDNVCIGTTSYLYNDEKSDIVGLVNQIDEEVEVFNIDLALDKSTKKGLRAYAEGFVKEGTGAGATSIAAFLMDEDLTQDIFLKNLEDNYLRTIEEPNPISLNKNS